jgi:hypothetical protein
MLIALFNKKPLHASGLKMIEGLGDTSQPDNFQEDVKALLSTTDLDEAIERSERFMNKLIEFLKQHNIIFEQTYSIDELNF